MKMNFNLFLEDKDRNKTNWKIGTGIGATGVGLGIYAMNRESEPKVTTSYRLVLNPKVKEFFEKIKNWFSRDDMNNLISGKMDPKKAKTLVKKLRDQTRNTTDEDIISNYLNQLINQFYN